MTAIKGEKYPPYDNPITRLVLSRSPGEGIQIGENIRVQIDEISRNKVRMSVEAPRDVEILRDELNSNWNVRVSRLSDSEIEEMQSATKEQE